MKHAHAHRIVPAVVMAAATAVPIVTAAEILTHVSNAGAAGGLASLPAASPPTATPAAATPTPRANPTVAAVRRQTPRPRATVVPPRTVAGPAVYDQYGAVQATITVSGKRITAVSITAPQNDPRSASINAQAVPLLRSETLQAQSAQVNLVSGATETSQAYIQSLQSAMSSAGL